MGLTYIIAQAQKQGFEIKHVGSLNYNKNNNLLTNNYIETL